MGHTEAQASCVITKDNLRSFDFDWKIYRKTAATAAARMPGAFTVETLEGPLSCADGWLALDGSGNPYPIDDVIFQKSYAQVAQAA